LQVVTEADQRVTLCLALVVVVPACLHDRCHLLLIFSAVLTVQLCSFVVCWTVWVWIMKKRLQTTQNMQHRRVQALSSQMTII